VTGVQTCALPILKKIEKITNINKQKRKSTNKNNQ
jgi:hypothetical protein